MSESINLNYEQNDLPTSSEVLNAFEDKRTTLYEQLAAENSKPGFKMSATDKIYHNRDVKQLTEQLDIVNQEWTAMGGEDIDAALALKEELGFKADASDHALANANIREARQRFYENFLASEEIDALENESVVQESAVSTLPAASLKPESVKPKKVTTEAATPARPESEEKVDVVTLPNGQTVSVTRTGDAISLKFSDDVESAAAAESRTDSEQSDNGEAARDAEDEPVRIKSKAEKFGQLLRNPAAYMSARFTSYFNSRPERSSSDDAVEKSKNKSRAVKGLIGVTAIVALAAGAKYGLHIGSGNHQAAVDAAPKGGNGAGMGHGAGTGTGFGPGHNTAPGAASPKMHEVLNQSGTTNVTPGEGWNSTMSEMGIPKNIQHSVLQQAGPELKNQGLAYFDKAHSEWRISAPGRLPDAAMKTLKAASAHNGYNFAA